MATMRQLIGEIPAQHVRARVPAEPLSVDADLFAARFASRVIVNVRMGLEEQFEIEQPGEKRRCRWFVDIAAIPSVLASLSCSAEPLCT